MRGFKDNIPPISYAIEHVRKVFEKYSKLYGCDMIDMPIIEDANLYFRTSGEDSDVCNKELFEARKYKGEFENWVLRPELTASCMRAIKENTFMQKQKFVRWAYFAPLFRYNRPQKGRYRQFLQGGWEFIGQENIQVDFEVISGAMQMLNDLKIDAVLEVNSIGSAQDRAIYRKQLREFLQLNENQDPLKVLDKMDEIKSDVPKLAINEADAKSFQELLNLLEKNNIKFIHNPFLVRGLDYYNSTVFEFKVNGQAVGGGGRYDGLMDQLDGGHVPAVGFALGADRLAECMNYEHINENIAIIPVDSTTYAHNIANIIRENKFPNLTLNKDYKGVSIFWDLSLKKALQEANKQNYKYAIICSKLEQEKNIIILKNLITSEQEEIKIIC